MARAAVTPLALALAACIALGASGCAPAAERQPAKPPPAETTATAFSAVKSANRVDVADAQSVVLDFVEALRSGDASAAASNMTSYRRAETREREWSREAASWKDARVKAVLHPGRYLNDERAFAQLYAEHFGHRPYKLVVLNVRYGRGPESDASDTDFVVTRDSAGAPWLVHDYGGALKPAPSPEESP